MISKISSEPILSLGISMDGASVVELGASDVLDENLNLGGFLLFDDEGLGNDIPAFTKRFTFLPLVAFAAPVKALNIATSSALVGIHSSSRFSKVPNSDQSNPT